MADEICENCNVNQGKKTRQFIPPINFNDPFYVDFYLCGACTQQAEKERHYVPKALRSK